MATIIHVISCSAVGHLQDFGFCSVNALQHKIETIMQLINYFNLLQRFPERV